MDAAAAADRRSREWSGAYSAGLNFPHFSTSGPDFGIDNRLGWQAGTRNRLEISALSPSSRRCFTCARGSASSPERRLRRSTSNPTRSTFPLVFVASAASDAADHVGPGLHGDERLQAEVGRRPAGLRPRASDGVLYGGRGGRICGHTADRPPLQRAVRFEKTWCCPTEEAARSTSVLTPWH